MIFEIFSYFYFGVESLMMDGMAYIMSRKYDIWGVSAGI